MGTHPIFESDFDCLTEWVIRIVKIIAMIGTVVASISHTFFDQIS